MSPNAGRGGGDPSVFGENIPTAEFEMIRQNSQIFNEDFYLPLYLPLWFNVEQFAPQKT
jgi:hypothetical protein